MQALVLDGRDPRVVSDWPRPERPAGEALVAMRTAGVCDTDLQLARGYMGYSGVLGHEFVGAVLEADDPSWIGKRVVADINAGCGECQDCLTRLGHHCEARTVLGIAGRGGAIAECLVVPQRNLVAVPDSLSDDAAVFAEPLAAALHVLDVLDEADESAIVLGDGKLGLLIAMALVGGGIATTVVGRHREKLALARGADTVLESERGDRRAAVVVEATGTTEGLSQALSMCEPRGKVILKTTSASPHSLDLKAVVIGELSVIGSRCGDMARAIECLATGTIDPTPLICARYPLADADAALEHGGRKGALKVLVDAG